MEAKNLSRSPRRNPWFWFAWLPLVGVGVPISYEHISRRTKTELLANYRNKIVQGGSPADVQSFVHWYEGRTHSESSERWGQIIQMIEIPLNTRKIPLLGDSKLPDVLDPNQPWKEAEYVESYLQHTAVVRSMIVEALKAPKPVRAPIKLEGEETRLYFLSATSLMHRYLGLEFEYAYYTRDTPRALQAIRLMDECSLALNYDLFANGALVELAVQQSKYSCVRRSLNRSQWSEIELRELLELSGRRSISTRQWRNCLYSERCFAIMSLERKHGSDNTDAQSNRMLMKSGTTHVDDYLNDMDLAISQAETADFRLERMEMQSKPKLMRSGIRDLMQLLSQTAAKAEDSRHWTRTAIALRLYQMLHGEFPLKLSDLQTLGLTPEEISTVDGTPFGYEVENQIAYLWTSEFSRDGSASIDHQNPAKRKSIEGHDNPIAHLLELR